MTQRCDTNIPRPFCVKLTAIQVSFFYPYRPSPPFPAPPLSGITLKRFAPGKRLSHGTNHVFPRWKLALPFIP